MIEAAPARSGFTSIELLCSIVMFTALSLSLVVVLSSSNQAVSELSAGAQVDIALLKVIDRLHTELDFAAADQVALLDPVTLQFASVQGWSGTQPLVGAPRQLQRVANRLELDGTILIGNVTAATMTVTPGVFSLELSVEAPYTRNGATEMLRRTATMIHRFEN